MKRPLSIIFFLLIGMASFAKQVFVSPTGNDQNAGTLVSPYLSVQKAHDVLRKGDTIYLRGGTHYPTTTTTFTKNGAGVYYKVLAYPLDSTKPFIDARDTPENSNTWLFEAASQYWYIKGIKIVGGKDNCIRVAGKFITLEQGETSYCGASSGTYTNQSGRGVLGYQCSNFTVKNWDSHHNADKGTDNNVKYDDADGFAILAAGPGCSFEGCRAWNNSDDGYDFYYGIGNTITLTNCSAWLNGYHYNTDTISGVPNATLADGNGFKLGGGESTASGSPHVLKNCYSWKNRRRGFDHNGNPGNIKLYNCTSWDNPLFNYYFSQAGYLRNCIAYGAGPNSFGANVDSKFNSWNLAANALDASDFISLNDGNMCAARTANGSIPYSDFLRLAQGSNLIDAGVDVGIPYFGTAPDLGAFESNFTITNIDNQYLLINAPIYPNPARNELFIIRNNTENYYYEITSIDGKPLQAGFMADASIFIENLKTGLYIIKIKTDAGETVQRFVKE